MVSPIPEEYLRGWEVIIDGAMASPSHIVLHNPRVGTVSFGFRPEGYDGVAIAENGGGGATTLPYFRDPEGTLFVGLLPENRMNMGSSTVLCIVGGFLDPGETHKGARDREADEEAGFAGIGSPIELCPEMPTNWNRLFSVANPGAGEGVHTWALEIPSEWLDRQEDGSYRITRLPEGMAGKLKKAAGVVFLPWAEAIRRSPDGIARAAIALLLAELGA